MAEPKVCAIMLTRDRPEYARRAVECFRGQTYDPIKRMLLIFDSGDTAWYDRRSDSENEVHLVASSHAGKTIGELRNIANEAADAAVMVHWDSDDWSHPNRIAEQVALLQSSGADCVGYREMLFWRTRRLDEVVGATYDTACGEAWLYSVPSPSWVLGTSFCYWRRVWEQHKFPDLPRLVDGKPVPDSASEDVIWRRGVKCVGFTSLHELDAGINVLPYKVQDGAHGEPRMIARIHGGNTTNYADLLGPRAGNTWKRAPEWDYHCREVMA